MNILRYKTIDKYLFIKFCISKYVFLRESMVFTQIQKRTRKEGRNKGGIKHANNLNF